MNCLIKNYKSVKNPFFIESVEGNPEEFRYKGRGEKRYGIGRQLLVRSCHDALVSCRNENGDRGILLVRRNAEPALGYLWSLGGFYDRGVSTEESLSSRIKNESGLEVDEESFTVVGHIRAMWKNTPYKRTEVSGELYDFVSKNDMSKMTLDEAMDLAEKNGFGREISDMTLQSFSDAVQEKGLPRGIDDTVLLFHVESSGGKLNLDKLHDRPRIITQNEYTSEFKSNLHEYMQMGMEKSFGNFY